MLLDWGTRYDIGSTFIVRTRGKSSIKQHYSSRGKRFGRIPQSFSGRYIKSRIPQGRPRNVAFDASLRAAAGRITKDLRSQGFIRITTPDIREKIRLQQRAAAILFLLDASGSMGANRRMVFTKGIILSIVNDAYHKRDRVALLTFRAAQTELLLPFTRSPQVAKCHLRRLAVGGKTPLGLGLKEAGILLRAESFKNTKVRPLLIAVSDGKGNVALEYDDPYDEAMHYAESIKRSSIESIFIDTEEDPCSFGYGPQVARAMGAHYLLAEDIIRRGVIELPL